MFYNIGEKMYIRMGYKTTPSILKKIYKLA